MDVTIRDAIGDADLERVLAIRNAMETDQQTLAALHAERGGAVAVLDLLAEAGGSDIGAGSIAWGPMSVESRNVFIFAWVLPEQRRQGIGGALLDRLVAFGREGGMERMTTLVYDTEIDTIAFLERRGLVVDGGGQLGRLDLTGPAADRGVEPIPGVTISTVAEQIKFEHDLYELHMVTRGEIPFLANEPNPSFETWQQMGAEGTGYLPGMSLVAIEDSKPIGVVEVFDNADQVIFIGMTAVHPDARRRGVARLRKVELERRARAASIRRIETFNDSTNARIRGLNESLGYVYDPPYVTMRGPLPSSRAIQRP